ncbi:hypothetical protein H310_07577 [Aphanomyces invadans]|uniref:Uncharacterized protein n=1 Tax=Aphanomyces invadans TaxID=157072 RepID=A0A024U1P0_9STRA|nr:hypothetical protein H310_07577 [Aphanomyces invadans]ETW00174.1 hypothetical protein H310_07577 [Aphanomyces invadans]|eukprot:XP_008871199.1 hypothetical protein H310_07577 [Aphanomyces invadans]
MTPFVSEINEDMLRQFEEELDGQRAKVEQARELIKHKKSLAIRKKAEEMRAAVADLDKTVVESRETRKTLRKQLLERKALMKTQVAAHQELQRTTWNVERAHHLEAVALKRLELERIHDEQRRMETLLDVATIELDAIEGEKRRRQESIDVQLKRILDKGTVLKQQLVEGHLNVPQVRQTIQDEGYDHFVEECHGLRRQQQQQRLLELHAQQKQLNTDRAKLLADEDVLRQQIHQHMSTDTVQDDLLDASLRGREPILPSSMPFPECDDCVDDVLAQASQFLAAGDATLSALQESIVNKCNVAHTNAACFPAAYDGSLGRESYPPSLLAARDMAQSIVWDVVNDLPPSVFETIRSLKQQRKQWKATQRRLARAHRRQLEAATILTIHRALVDDVVDEMLRDLHHEFESLACRVHSLVTGTITASLITPPFNGANTVSSQLASALQEMQLRRARQDMEHRPFTWLFPRHALSQPLVPKIRETLDASSGAKKFGGKKESGSTRSMQKSQPFLPPRAPSLRQVSIDAISRTTPPAALVAMEAECWKHVLFQAVTNVTLPFAAACVQMHRVEGGTVLCAGGIKGELVLMDLAASTVVRQRLDPPQPVRISSIQTFGTHVLVSASSQLQLWTTRPVKDRALSIVFHLTKDDLQSVGHKLQDVTTGCFVPAASLAGTPTSILVGTADGSICRLNRSTDDCRAVFGAGLVPRPCLANTMSPMILPPNPRHTLYQFHRAAIIFLATVGHPLSPSFLSVDATGVVCRWDNDNWTGFGWFEPAQSVQLVGSGVVQSCLLAPDTSRLVVFTFEGTKRQGAFVQVAWEPSLSVLPVVIRIGCEAPPPPFTLLPSPAALSRTSCDCVLVMGSSLALYSLATGQVLTPASPSTISCKSPAVSVTSSDGYVVGCGSTGKIMAFEMQDLASLDAIRAVQVELAPFHTTTPRRPPTIARVNCAGDRRMVRAVVVATIEEILSQFLPHPTSSTMLSSPTLA